MTELEGLRGIEHLYAEDLLHILHYPHTLGSGVCAHAHMILLTLRRINGIHHTGGTQLLVLAHYGGSRILRDHESGVQTGLGHQE